MFSMSSKRSKDNEDVKSARSRDNVKITRHSSRPTRSSRARADRNDSQDVLQDQTGLEHDVVSLKLRIANARTEEEEERQHARRVANVNDRLRSLYEEQKKRAKGAREDVDRLNKELERMRKLKAQVAPQIQQDRIKAWYDRRRASNDGSGSFGPTPTRDGRRSNRRGSTGASVSSWSAVSVHSLFERVERSLAGLEQETVATLNTSEASN